MMSERQKQFRAEYQAQIHPLYSGLVHVGVMYAIGIAVIAFCVSRMQAATWEWLLVVPVFVVSNLFEWWIHKYVMHRLVDVWALRAIYDRHTRQHHVYFTDGGMTVDSTREFRIIFFPWRALFTFIALWTGGLIAPSFALLAVIIAGMLADAAWFPLSNLLLAINRHGSWTYAYLAAAAISIVVGIPLVASMGALGMAWALLAQELVMAVWVWRVASRFGLVSPAQLRSAAHALIAELRARRISLEEPEI